MGSGSRQCGKAYILVMSEPDEFFKRAIKTESEEEYAIPH